MSNRTARATRAASRATRDGSLHTICRGVSKTFTPELFPSRVRLRRTTRRKNFDEKDPVARYRSRPANRVGALRAPRGCSPRFRSRPIGSRYSEENSISPPGRSRSEPPVRESCRSPGRSTPERYHEFEPRDPPALPAETHGMRRGGSAHRGTIHWKALRSEPNYGWMRKARVV